MATESIDDFEDDETGYQNPPVKHQFKEGQSGNHRGRSKGRHGLNTLIGRALKRKVSITIRGKKVRVTMLDLIIRKLTSMSLAGNIQATELLVQFPGANYEVMDLTPDFSQGKVPTPLKNLAETEEWGL